MITSDSGGTTSDKEWQNVTANNNKQQQMAISDSEWERVVQPKKANGSM